MSWVKHRGTMMPCVWYLTKKHDFVQLKMGRRRLNKNMVNIKRPSETILEKAKQLQKIGRTRETRQLKAEWVAAWDRYYLQRQRDVLTESNLTNAACVNGQFPIFTVEPLHLFRLGILKY